MEMLNVIVGLEMGIKLELHANYVDTRLKVVVS